MYNRGSSSSGGGSSGSGSNYGQWHHHHHHQQWQYLNIGCITLYTILLHAASVNSRTEHTSNLWRLDNNHHKIVTVDNTIHHHHHQNIGLPEETLARKVQDDTVFNIITSTVHFGQTWTKEGYDLFCTDCQLVDGQKSFKNNSFESYVGLSGEESQNDGLDDEFLDCGKSVNFTYYDNLVGVARRHRHPNVPEPQVALIFTKKKNYKNGGTVSDFDVNALEKRLKKAKREKPKSVQLYNQIGNYWRIKGDTRQSIECFRRALAVSPHNAEVLLNLARVLFTLQYLDDAIYLTRRSLEVQPPDRSAWQQYFTLGEIFKAYGHYHEASLHLRHALDLRPDFEPALAALKEIDSIPEATIHVYTLIIIICLVMGVLLVILSSVDGNTDTEEHKIQRHFNRAMAMRSLRSMAIPPARTLRSKKGGP